MAKVVITLSFHIIRYHYIIISPNFHISFLVRVITLNNFFAHYDISRLKFFFLKNSVSTAQTTSYVFMLSLVRSLKSTRKRCADVCPTGKDEAMSHRRRSGGLHKINIYHLYGPDISIKS